MSCSFCDVEFADRDEQVRHYKSDFHRFNLKRRLRGAPPVTEEGFEDIAGRENIGQIFSLPIRKENANSKTEPLLKIS